jgi:hypothetical protein
LEIQNIAWSFKNFVLNLALDRAANAVGPAAPQATSNPNPYAQVDCSTTTGVTEVVQRGSPTDRIIASVGDQILFNSPQRPKGFTFPGNLLNNTVCTFNGNICTVKTGTNGQTFTYAAKDNNCPANANEQFTVNP